MNRRIRLFIIDDNRLFIESITPLLDAQQDIQMVGMATDAHEAFKSLQSLKMDVVLMAAGMDQTNIVEWIHNLEAAAPKLRVIVFGLNGNNEYILELIEAGASGYVLKNASFDEMLETVRSVFEGRPPCSPLITARLFERMAQLSKRHSTSPSKRLANLTPREQEILEFIALGLGNKEIAQQLHISIFTVKNHVHNLLEKLQLCYRREAIRFAYENGLVENHPIGGGRAMALAAKPDGQPMRERAALNKD